MRPGGGQDRPQSRGRGRGGVGLGGTPGVGESRYSPSEMYLCGVLSVPIFSRVLVDSDARQGN